MYRMIYPGLYRHINKPDVLMDYSCNKFSNVLDWMDGAGVAKVYNNDKKEIIFVLSSLEEIERFIKWTGGKFNEQISNSA